MIADCRFKDSLSYREIGNWQSAMFHEQIRQTVWPASGSCGRTVVPERPFSRGPVGRPDSLSYLHI